MEIFNYYFLKFQLDNLKKNDYYWTINELAGYKKNHLRLFGFRPVRIFYPLQLFWVLLKHQSKIRYIYTGYARQSWIIPFFSAIIYRLFKKPYIVTIHSGEKPVWKPAFLFKYYFNNADTVVGVSEAICEEYGNLLSGKKVHFIPPLIPFQHSEKSKEQLKAEFGFSPASKILLYVGSLKQLKNPDKVVKAFNLFSSRITNNKEINLVMVGDGEMMEALQQYARDNHLTGSVFFAGLKSRESIPDFFAMADYYIISSDYEGTSISLLEAMFNKLPIIAANSPGINKMLQANRNALLYPPHDTEKLAGCIQALTSDAVLSGRLAEKAHMDFEEKYSYGLMIEKYEQLFNNHTGRAD
jgi:glycosyltransferase involved in cell wall biosynthesis